VVFSGGSPHSRNPARQTSMQPITRRISSNPVPGLPPANVEYKRRKTLPFAPPECHIATAYRDPKESCNCDSFEAACRAIRESRGQELEFDDPSLDTNHGGLGSIVGA